MRLNSTYYLIAKIKNQRELRNIAINHSADINWKDLIKIFREYTKKPYSFLIIKMTLPVSDLLAKACFLLIKMTVTDQIKI